MIRIVIFVFLIAGLFSFFYSFDMPKYKDQRLADKLLSDCYGISKSEFYKNDFENRTNKNIFMDVGSGVAVASATLLLFMIVFRLNNFNDIRRIKSASIMWIFVISNINWLLLFPSTIWYYTFRAQRGDYPPFADSIAIPIMSQSIAFLVFLIPMNIFLIVTSINCQLPTTLFNIANIYNIKIVVFEVFFGFILLLNFMFLISAIIDGDHISIPIYVSFFYVLLSLRAGIIRRHNTYLENVHFDDVLS